LRKELIQTKIANHDINDKVFIIAEMSCNHKQDLYTALEIVKQAKWAGADAIKVQTFTPDTITIDCHNDYFKIKQNSAWDGRYLYDLYKEAYLQYADTLKIQKYAEQLGLIFFSTPSDQRTTDFLERSNVPCYKISSYEITDIPLIRYIASKGKPVILSSGIATIDDIIDAIEACHEVGNDKVILLKCVSAYPTPLEEVNLKAIPYLQRLFNVPVGLSDHTLGISVPIASVALGARVIEKHLCLDRNVYTLDSHFSLEPQEFKDMVKSVREVEKALGKGGYVYTDRMRKGKEMARSLFCVKDIKKGEKFTHENVRSIRPGFGISPKYLDKLLGDTAEKNYKRGEPIK
jgi:pseudaminic acid synthase